MASFCWFVQLPDRTSILLEGVSFHSLSFSVPPAQPLVSLQRKKLNFCSFAKVQLFVLQKALHLKGTAQ